MKLRILTHAERDLRGTLPYLWPEFMKHDPIVNSFWPRLYELCPDFPFWVVDGRETVGYACTVPIRSSCCGRRGPASRRTDGISSTRTSS